MVLLRNRSGIGFSGQNASIGRRAGVIQMCRTDDMPRSMVISGRLGAFVKEQVPLRPSRYRHRGPAAGPDARNVPQTTDRGRTRPGGRVVTGTDAHATQFTQLRPLLFTVAYEILGRRPKPTTMLQGKLSAVGAGRPVDRRQCALLSGADRHPAIAQHVCARWEPAPRRIRRALAARTDPHRRRPRR